MYEGLFLNPHRALESFIEDLFLGLLVEGTGYESSRKDIHARLRVKSHALALELLLGPRGTYVDWLPYQRTLDLAKLYFRGGRPFADLPSQYQQQIGRSVALRNAIAHTGRFSQERFQKFVVQGARLPRGHRTPAGYLRDVYASNPIQTRYELFAAQLLSAARTLAK